MRVQKEVKRDSAKQESPFNKLFSSIFKEYFNKSDFNSMGLLANFFEENSIEINKNTIETYTREEPPSPSLYKAAALSKALNFSLDELRDGYFDFEPPAETVQGKILEYYYQYLETVKMFPKLSNFDYYNDMPCFVEFLKKIEGIDDIELIKTIAMDFNKRYFIRHNKIEDKQELKNVFINRWQNYYVPCGGRDKKTVLEELFNKLCLEYTDLNELYKRINYIDIANLLPQN